MIDPWKDHPEVVASRELAKVLSKLWPYGTGICPKCKEWIGTMMMEHILDDAETIHRAHGGT